MNTHLLILGSGLSGSEFRQISGYTPVQPVEYLSAAQSPITTLTHRSPRARTRAHSSFSRRWWPQDAGTCPALRAWRSLSPLSRSRWAPGGRAVRWCSQRGRWCSQRGRRPRRCTHDAKPRPKRGCLFLKTRPVRQATQGMPHETRAWPLPARTWRRREIGGTSGR